MQRGRNVTVRVESKVPANKEKISRWARDYWDALHPYSAGGAYVNFMMDEGEDRVRATYGKNYDRLAKIKKRYDPTSLFRVKSEHCPRKVTMNRPGAEREAS